MTQNNTHQKSFWRTEIADIMLMLGFVGIVQLLSPVLSSGLPDWAQLPLGIALAVIPAILWLSIFHAQDRAEPEPRHFVVGVAVLSGLLAAAIGQPLLNGFFRIESWIHHDSLTELLGSILVVGVLQELLKFAAVRFSIWHSNEFDQRIDGVLYGTAAGVGYATLLNLSAVLASDGFADIGAGVVRIVITSLAHGAVGGLIGYFLSRARFDREPVWWLPLGVLLAALINGVFSWLRGAISQGALTLNSDSATAGYNAVPALALSAVVAAGLFALVFGLMRRGNSREAAKHVNQHDTATALITLVIAALALAAGLLVRNSVESRVKSYAHASGVKIAYPDSWRLDTRLAEDGILRARDPQSNGYPTTLELRWVAIDPALDDKAAVANVSSSLAINRARDEAAFKAFDLSMGGANGITAAGTYVFVANTGGALQESIPSVVLGEDRYVRRGDKVFVFSLHSTDANRAVAQAQFERFISAAALL